jgi:GT2 family glycosyltransferase
MTAGAGNQALAPVCIVTLNWNNAPDTIACVESLRALDPAGLRIVICDNASRSDAVEALRAWGRTLPGGLPESSAPLPPAPQAGQAGPPGAVVLVHTGGNLGYAGGMNVGIRHALGDPGVQFVWILNNDTVVAPDALGHLLARVSADERIGICGSTLVYFDKRQQVQAFGGAAYLPWRARSMALGAFSTVADIPQDPAATERRMAYVNGASMLVSRAFVERVGLMDESYFLYSEEHDWAHRGRRLGFRLGYAPASRVFHKHGATIGTSPSGGSELSLFYLYRNKLLFAARHYPLLLVTSIPMLAWEGIKLFLKGRFGKGRAVFRGMLAAPRLGRY